jgi:hypothetical protein
VLLRAEAVRISTRCRSRSRIALGHNELAGGLRHIQQRLQLGLLSEMADNRCSELRMGQPARSDAELRRPEHENFSKRRAGREKSSAIGGYGCRGELDTQNFWSSERLKGWSDGFDVDLVAQLGRTVYHFHVFVMPIKMPNAVACDDSDVALRRHVHAGE